MLLLIILGLAGLWLGTRWIIKGALGLAGLFKLSHAFVGLAILAVGTDLPELSVTIKASLLQLDGTESSGIITGNAIGSCISQIGFILGISGLLMRLRSDRKMLQRDSAALLGSIGLLFIFGWDGLISRVEGAALTVGYIVYYIFLLRGRTESEPPAAPSGKKPSKAVLVVLLTSGFVLLIASSSLMVDNAILLAQQWGLAQTFVGILIVGLGTSLPELAVSVGAAIRKSAGMSVGNVVGSNVFDSFLPIGLGGLISTVHVDRGLLRFDLPFMLGLTLLAIIFMYRRQGIGRLQGLLLVGAFMLYVAFKVVFAGS